MLKVNSNDLRWLKEQKSSKDAGFFQQNHDSVVRLSNNKRLSKFSPVGDINPHSEEEIKAPHIEIINSCSSESESSSLMYCVCGSLCEGDNTECNRCLQKKTPIDFSGSLLAHINFGVKKYWFRLLNKELYCNPTKAY